MTIHIMNFSAAPTVNCDKPAPTNSQTPHAPTSGDTLPPGSALPPNPRDLKIGLPAGGDTATPHTSAAEDTATPHTPAAEGTPTAHTPATEDTPTAYESVPVPDDWVELSLADLPVETDSGDTPPREPMDEGWVELDPADYKSFKDFPMKTSSKLEPNDKAVKTKEKKKSPASSKAMSEEFIALDPSEINKELVERLNKTLQKLSRVLVTQFRPDVSFKEMSDRIGGERLKQEMQSKLDMWIESAKANSTNGYLTEKDVDDIESMLRAMAERLTRQVLMDVRGGKIKLG